MFFVKMNHFVLALQFMMSLGWKQSHNIAIFQHCLSLFDMVAHQHFDFIYSYSFFYKNSRASLLSCCLRFVMGS